MKDTTDRKLILRAVGEYDFFRQEIMESDLQEALEEFKGEIPVDVTWEDENWIEFEDVQVIFWMPADTPRIKEYLDCAWWCAQYSLTGECQEFIDMAQGQIQEV